jgi:hypothetical protein
MTSVKFLVISGIYMLFFLLPALGLVMALSAFGDFLG